MSEDRKLAVLRAIVEDYVATEEPVGSKALVERHRLGVSPATVRNPATLLPALSRKTHAWTDSTIRDDFPDKLRIAIDRMDAKTRRTTFRVIAKASAASGFEAAVRAGEHLVEQGHAIDEASVTTMARRIAAGEKPYEQSVPDLTGYDVFMKPRQPWERKEA